MYVVKSKIRERNLPPVSIAGKSIIQGLCNANVNVSKNNLPECYIIIQDIEMEEKYWTHEQNLCDCELE